MMVVKEHKVYGQTIRFLFFLFFVFQFKVSFLSSPSLFCFILSINFSFVPPLYPLPPSLLSHSAFALCIEKFQFVWLENTVQ